MKPIKILLGEANRGHGKSITCLRHGSEHACNPRPVLMLSPNGAKK
jgi:hypothetical protein